MSWSSSSTVFALPTAAFTVFIPRTAARRPHVVVQIDYHRQLHENERTTASDGTVLRILLRDLVRRSVVGLECVLVDAKSFDSGIERGRRHPQLGRGARRSGNAAPGLHKRCFDQTSLLLRQLIRQS